MKLFSTDISFRPSHTNAAEGNLVILVRLSSIVSCSRLLKIVARSPPPALQYWLAFCHGKVAE